MKPFEALRERFVEAHAQYGDRPFALYVTEWSGSCLDIQKFNLGYAGLPVRCNEGSIEEDSPAKFYAIPWSADESVAELCVEGGVGWLRYEDVSFKQRSQEALDHFKALATMAGSALPVGIRDAITPGILEHLKTGNDPHPPSDAIIWWLVFLWWQVDREFFALEFPRRDVTDRESVIAPLVNWHSPFQASVAAIDRCGLLKPLPPDGPIPLRRVDEREEALRRERAEYEGRAIGGTDADGQWFDAPPGPTSLYKHGPIEGTLSQLSLWSEQDRRTLRKHNGRSSFYVQKLHGHSFALWCNAETLHKKIVANAEAARRHAADGMTRNDAK